MSGTHDIQVVVFGLGEEEFALPVTTVREILDHRNAYRVPHAPDWFLGLTDVRGESVPMVDLRVRLGLSPVEPTLTTRILVVDRVLDVATVAAGSVEGAPDLGGRWRSDQIEAILRRGAGFVALLDPARLFGADGAQSALADLGMAA